jgi:hypothetical protein
MNVGCSWHTELFRRPTVAGHRSAEMIKVRVAGGMLPVPAPRPRPSAPPEDASSALTLGVQRVA